MVAYMTARCSVASGLLVFYLQSFHGECSSGHLESTKQPSPDDFAFYHTQ